MRTRTWAHRLLRTRRCIMRVGSRSGVVLLLALCLGLLDWSSTSAHIPDDPGAARWPSRGAETVQGPVARGATMQTLALTPAVESGAPATVWQRVAFGPNDPAEVGAWSAVAPWPIVAVHLAQMPSGEVVAFDAWERNGAPTAQLWNPTTDTFRSVPNLLAQIFCAGQAMLADGRTITVGGYIDSSFGIRDTTIFDGTSAQWSRAADMAYPRWYPTALTLGDGRVLAVGGEREPNEYVSVPEVYSPTTNTWTQLTGATRESWNYPQLHNLPSGLVFMVAGPDGQSMTLDVGRQKWRSVGFSPAPNGVSVEYAPGRILSVGNLPHPTATGVIDMTVAQPRWYEASPMAYPRFQFNLVLLPDGKVLAIGGSDNESLTSTTGILPAEMWDPATESWTVMPSLQDLRLYHSAAILLRDGRVLVAGGGRFPPALDYLTAQIYSPAYLFRGPRPTITDAPSSVSHGQTLEVRTPDAASLSGAVLVRMSSVTHSTNSDQVRLPLAFTPVAGGIQVTAPSNPHVAPPGPYMLFLMSDQGVPSVASVIQISGGVAAVPPPPPTDDQAPLASGPAMLADGFEGETFAGGGWTPVMQGSGAAVELVQTPAGSGAQVARMSTQTQTSGQQAMVERPLTWPASNVIYARARVMPEATRIQSQSKIMALTTRGPNSWVTRAGFALGASTISAIFTTRDGVLRTMPTPIVYQAGRWYDLAIAIDWRHDDARLTFLVDGVEVHSVLDAGAGTHTDRPASVSVGFSPVSWMQNYGAVNIDDVSVFDGDPTGGIFPTATPTSNVTFTPTPTLSLTAAATATATASPPPTGDAYQISIASFAFQPETQHVAVGDTVTWANQHERTHTSTSRDGSWDSGSLAPGTTFGQTFLTPGTYAYFCKIHQNMTGAIIVSERPTPPPATTIDSTDGQIAFSGWWPTRTDGSAIGGSERIGEFGGDSASLTFTGAVISLVYHQDVDRGQAQIWLDDQPIGMLDQFGSAHSQRATAFDVSPGTHTLRVVVNRTKQAASSGYTVGLDAFVVAASGTPPATLTATATSTLAPDPSATATITSTLAPTPTVTVTATRTAEPTATASATATAAATTTPTLTATPTRTPTSAAPTLTATASPSPTDTRPPTQTPSPTLTPTPGSGVTIDSSSSQITFSGWWPTQIDGTALGGSERIGEFGGDAMTVSFTGSSVSLIYRQNTNRGRAQIRIDNVAVAMLDQYGPSVAQKSVTYSVAPGTHTLRVVINRTKQNASSGYFVGVDAVIVTGAASPTPTQTLAPTPTPTPTAAPVALGTTWVTGDDVRWASRWLEAADTHESATAHRRTSALPTGGARAVTR